MPKKIFILFIMIFSMFFLVPKANAKPMVETNKVEYRLAGEEDCKKLDPKGKFLKFLQDIFDIMKYAGPVLCLVLSTMDFIKAAASQDKEALKKAASRSMKRLALAMILFFIPTLINFLFPLFGWNGTCGIN